MSGIIRLKYVLSVIVLFTALIAWGNPVSAATPACEPTKLVQKYPSLAGKTLTVAMPSDSKPIAYRDPNNLDNLIGFAADYARGVFLCLGAPFKFMVAPLSGGLAAASSGQADMVWSTIYYTPERAKALDFVLYQKAASGGVVPKDNPKHISSFEDLCGHSAVSQIGSLEAVKLGEASKACLDKGKAAIDIVTAPDRASGLRLLDSGRADLYLGIGIKGAYPDNLTMSFIYTSDIRAGIGLTKGSAELERAVVDAVAALQANGFERKLYETYDIDPSLTFPPTIVTQ